MPQPDHTTSDRPTTPPSRGKLITALSVVGALLAIIVLGVGPSDPETVSLGVTTGAFDDPEERPEPDDDDDRARPRRLPPTVITIPVPQFVTVPDTRRQPAVLAVPVEVAVPESRAQNGPAAPEIGQFFVDTEAPSAGETTRFRWFAGDSDGIIRGVQVRYGDGTADQRLAPDRCVDNPSDPMTERPPFEHVYEEPGRYNVTLTVISTGACANGPTQRVTEKITVDVGIFGVTPPGGFES